MHSPAKSVPLMGGAQLSAYRFPGGKGPVFVVGCPRSGTTLLYHMILSSGGFAIYRAESHVFNLLVPRFGNLRSEANRRRLLDYWLGSEFFRVSGLERDAIAPRVMDQCRTGGDFLRITMEEICRSQGVTRWAECTPDHLLYLPEIAEQFQDASVIHIIRDGHDVALSNVRQGWLRPLSWDRGEHLTVAGLYWEWSVRKGMQYGKALGARYCQVRFLDLVSKPRQVLWRLGRFIGHELDYDRIVKTGIGSVSSPNSSFPSEACKEGFPPAGRWKRKMSPTEVQQFEDVLGDFLQELGYEVTAPSLSRKSLRSQRLRATYLPLFSDKKWLKSKTPLGRLVDVASLTTVPWLNAC